MKTSCVIFLLMLASCSAPPKQTVPASIVPPAPKLRAAAAASVAVVPAIHLHRARLFFREPEYPWNKNPDGTPRGPKDDLTAAEELINECGYHRRDEELADAKRAILGT